MTNYWRYFKCNKINFGQFNFASYVVKNKSDIVHFKSVGNIECHNTRYYDTMYYLIKSYRINRNISLLDNNSEIVPIVLKILYLLKAF